MSKKKKGKRCLMLALIIFLSMTGMAFADQTGTTFWHSHSYTVPEDNDMIYAVDKYSEYQKKQNMPVGAGVDVVLYEFQGVASQYGLDSINTEYKYDVANNKHSVYGVVHVNAWRVVEKYIK